MFKSRLLKVFTIAAIFLSTSAFARHFTTYGRGHGVDYYGNTHFACRTAQQNAHYNAADACHYYYGRVRAVSVSACGCGHRVVNGRYSLVCVADARVVCETYP